MDKCMDCINNINVKCSAPVLIKGLPKGSGNLLLLFYTHNEG